MNLSTQLPECLLSNSISYSCENPYPNCTNPAGFQFASLWIITQAIYNACPTDARLFHTSPLLTQQSCEIFVGSDAWTPYPAADIWARLTTWKFPLLQLVAVFPRPPLSFLSELFVLVHLLGDPISTINNLLLKVASCQGRAEFWRDHFSDYGLLRALRQPGGDISKIWKGLAAITDSYDEWGQDKGLRVEAFILERLTSNISREQKLRFLDVCKLTANALAADRSTKFLPIIVAQCFFIGTVGIAFGRTKDSASGPNPPTFINIEAHSIAFSALYFWIIPAVFVASIIGVSQTENAIPRILMRFGDHVQIAFPEWDARLLKESLAILDGPTPHTELLEIRERNGGIYSWQPPEPRALVIANLQRTAHLFTHSPNVLVQLTQSAINTLLFQPGSHILPFTIVTAGFFTGALISLLVPPVGIDCRHIGELLIYLTWVLSFLLNFIPFSPSAHKSRFLFILIKDAISTALTMGGIIATQIGVFNRCACYTLWGRTGLALPENFSVASVLFWRINTAYPAIAFLCVGFQLVIVPGLVIWRYGFAIRVFLQRDDDASNLEWLDGVWRFFGKIGGFGRWVGRWIGSMAVGTKRWGERRMERRYQQSYQVTDGLSGGPGEEFLVDERSKPGDSEHGYSVVELEERPRENMRV